MAIKYEDGKIYKIVCNVTNLVYIGSTCQRLSQRLAKHVSDYKCWKDGKFNYVTSFKILEGGDYDIVLIKNVKCNNKEELHAQERKVIESMKCVNKAHPTRTKKEYYEDNLENIKEKSKQRYEDKKAELLKQMKQYRDENKDKIKEQQSQKFTCECGGHYTNGHKSQHIKSSKHQKFINKTE